MTTLHMMLAFLLCAIGAACGGLYWFTATSPAFDKTGGAYTPFLLFGIVCFLAGLTIMLLTIFQKKWMRQARNHFRFRMLELLLLAGSAILFFSFHWKAPAMLFALMTVVVVFAIFWEKRTATAGEIIINDEGVKMPVTARRRFIEWVDIDRVLLRFGILTIECTDNRLVQRNVVIPTFSADELEAYCNRKIEENRNKRDKHDW